MKILFVLILAILLSISINGFAQDVNFENSLRKYVIPFDTAISNDNLTDLLPLDRVFKNRKIIGFGEATHGTHEFNTTRIRMFKFLVKKEGFRLFGIEANFTECRVINDYISYGNGDVKKAIAGMHFWVWRTKDILNLVEWMRRYNVNNSDGQKLKFYGFDMQFDQYAIEQLTLKLKKFDSTYFNSHFSLLQKILIYNTSLNRYTTFSKSGKDSIENVLAKLKSYIQDNKGNLMKSMSKDEISYCEQDVRILQQCLAEDEAMTKGNHGLGPASNLRDKFMAENITWILNHEGTDSKIMLWAHNYHISKNAKAMGGLLKNSFHEQYFAVGADFNKGSFRAVDLEKPQLKSFTVQDAKPGSSGILFSTLNIPCFFLDIEAAVKEKSPAGSLFERKIFARHIGAGYDEQKQDEFYTDDPLYSLFDGLIFVNSTSPTIAL